MSDTTSKTAQQKEILTYVFTTIGIDEESTATFIKKWKIYSIPKLLTAREKTLEDQVDQLAEKLKLQVLDRMENS